MTGLTGLRRLSLVLVLVAMALGLGNRDAPEPQRPPGLDVLVAIDRTTSMSALDHRAGSRIDGVRRDLVRLGRQLGTARFAMVAFGRGASLQLPFTNDRVAYRDAVRSVQVEGATAGSGSSIDQAVPMLQQILDEAPTKDDRLSVLLFLSDGENTARGEQASFAGLGERVDAGVVLGFGTDAGAVMPLARVPLDEEPPSPEDPGPVVTIPETGEPALSRRDADNLRQIAGELDAAYLPCAGAEDMERVAARLQEIAYAELEPVDAERQVTWLWALLLLLLVLPDVRAGWRQYLEARREGRT